MKNLQAIKVGNVINVSLNGNFYKKVFDTNEEALECYRKVIDIKNNYDEETSPNEIMGLFNKTKRVLLNANIEYTEHDNQYYLKGYNTPIPEDIVNVIIEYTDNNFPLEPILNFWELLMLNTDKHVHKSLFKYLSHYNFMINDDGYFVGYKAVTSGTDVVEDAMEISDENKDIVLKAYDKIKRWKKSPKNYIVLDTDPYKVVSIDNQTYVNTDSIGTLENVYEMLQNNNPLKVAKQKTFYTDKHTRTMRIELGVPQVQDRETCDNDPSHACSHGLHVGTPDYAKGFASGTNDKILICLVNPMNVVAVPNNDAEKLRACEYIPIGEAEKVDGELVTIEGSYIETTFTTHEKDQIEEMANQLKENQKPLGEDRNIDELKKMYNNRLFKLNNL